MGAPMRLLFTGVVHPWLCDAMGHLTTRHYMAMFDDASYRLLYEVLDYAGSSGEFEGLGWADVKHQIEYKQEVRAGTLVEVRGEVRRLGTKSITAYYELRDVGGTVAATMEGVTAFFDLRARKALAIPDGMRARFNERSGSPDS